MRKSFCGFLLSLISLSAAGSEADFEKQRVLSNGHAITNGENTDAIGDVRICLPTSAQVCTVRRLSKGEKTNALAATRQYWISTLVKNCPDLTEILTKVSANLSQALIIGSSEQVWRMHMVNICQPQTLSLCSPLEMTMLAHATEEQHVALNSTFYSAIDESLVQCGNSIHTGGLLFNISVLTILFLPLSVPLTYMACACCNYAAHLGNHRAKLHDGCSFCGAS